MRNYLFIISLALLSASCGSPSSKQADEKSSKSALSISDENSAAFYQKLQSLCGKSFAGQELYMKEGRESWAHLPFKMFVTRCDNQEIHIPFHVGENKSRTWMFIVEDGRLRFRHDHRHEDGTPEDLTLYGGYANDKGTPFRQEFPADDYTVNVHPRSEGSVWVVELADDMSSFNYQLHHHGELLFHGKFDLTKEISED